jgi:hypothetical protein
MDTKGEKLLFYPQMTQMTQIFFRGAYGETSREAVKASEKRNYE